MGLRYIGDIFYMLEILCPNGDMMARYDDNVYNDRKVNVLNVSRLFNDR